MQHDSENFQEIPSSDLNRAADLDAPKEPQHDSKLIIVVILILLPVIGLFGYLLSTRSSAQKVVEPTVVTPSPTTSINTSDEGQTACTLDAKICPDGSAVGRTGPNCEFAPCADDAEGDEQNWKQYTNSDLGISFKYPTQRIEVREQKYSNRATPDIILYSKETRDLGGFQVKLLEFSPKYNVATYEDPNVPTSIEQNKYQIQGDRYDAWHFSFGEGSACGSSSVSTEAVALPDEVFMYLYKTTASRNRDKDCRGNEFGRFETLESDIELAGAVIETILFLE